MAVFDYCRRWSSPTLPMLPLLVEAMCVVLISMLNGYGVRALLHESFDLVAIRFITEIKALCTEVQTKAPIEVHDLQIGLLVVKFC